MFRREQSATLMDWSQPYAKVVHTEQTLETAKARLWALKGLTSWITPNMQKLQEQTLDTALRPYYCWFPWLAEGRVLKLCSLEEVRGICFPGVPSTCWGKSSKALFPGKSKRDMLSWGRVLPISLRARKLLNEKYFAISPKWFKLLPEKKLPSAFGGQWFVPMRNSTTAFGVWKLFPSSYFWRNFSLMKYGLNGRIFIPEFSLTFLDKILSWLQYFEFFAQNWAWIFPALPWVFWKHPKKEPDLLSRGGQNNIQGLGLCRFIRFSMH